MSTKPIWLSSGSANLTLCELGSDGSHRLIYFGGAVALFLGVLTHYDEQGLVLRHRQGHENDISTGRLCHRVGVSLECVPIQFVLDFFRLG